MTISELIEKLEAIRASAGDLPVTYHDGYDGGVWAGGCAIETVEVKAENGGVYRKASGPEVLLT